ncbi:MAG: hypothetical protein ACJAZ1_003722, partial [Yoonia sp.]
SRFIIGVVIRRRRRCSLYVFVKAIVRMVILTL